MCLYILRRRQQHDPRNVARAELLDRVFDKGDREAEEQFVKPGRSFDLVTHALQRHP